MLKESDMRLASVWRFLQRSLVVLSLFAAPAAAQSVAVGDAQISAGTAAALNNVLGNRGDVYLRVGGDGGAAFCFKSAGDGLATGWTCLDSYPTGSGADTYVTYWSGAGTLTGEAGFTYTAGSDLLAVPNLTVSTALKNTALTATRMTFAGADGLLADDADCTFTTDTLSCTKVLAPTSVSTPSIITAAGNLSLTPVGYVDFDTIAQTSTYVSKLTGWQINTACHADFRRLFANSIIAEIFEADLAQVFASMIIVPKSFGVVASAFTCPAYSGVGTLTVRDFPSALDMNVYETGDSVRVMTFTRAGGGLTIGDCVGVVTVPVNNADDTQSWTFTRYADGLGVPFAADGGSLAGSTVIAVENVAMDYGTTGTQFALIDSWDGAYNVNGSYFQTAHWLGSPTDGNFVLDCRMGNLLGITGVAGERGLLCGDWANRMTTGEVFRASTAGVELHNVDLKLYDTGVNVVRLDPAAASLALGPVATGVPTAFGTGVGLWADPDDFRVGDPAGNRLSWEGGGTDELLVLANQLTIDNDGIGLTVNTSTAYEPTRAFRFTGGALGGNVGLSVGESGTDRYMFLINEEAASAGKTSQIYIGATGGDAGTASFNLTAGPTGSITYVNGDVSPTSASSQAFGDVAHWWGHAYVGTLHGFTFENSTATAFGGWQWVVPGAGNFDEDVAVGETSIDFNCTLAVGDFVFVAGKDAAGTYRQEYMEVTVDETGGVYTVARDKANSNPVNQGWSWPRNMSWLNKGASGDGRIELNAYDTPQIQVVIQGATYAAQSNVVRLG